MTTKTIPQVTFAGVTFNSLRGRGVIVTGGASGIGADIVRAVARQSCAVGFVDRDEAAGAALAKSLVSTHFIRFDVTDVPAPKTAIAQFLQPLGRAEVLGDNLA